MHSRGDDAHELVGVGVWVLAAVQRGRIAHRYSVINIVEIPYQTIKLIVFSQHFDKIEPSVDRGGDLNAIS